jgi:hypothetical protein
VNWHQTSLIARYSARYSVRGGIGLVFLLLSLTFGLMVAHFMLQPVEMLAKQAAQHSTGSPEENTRRVLESLTSQAKPVVSWMLSTKADKGPDGRRDAAAESWADYLLEGRPAMLSAIFLILLWGWPFVVAFGAFDLYAGDISSRQLRYQLLRADRGSIFFGRLLGMIVTFVAVLLLLGVTVTVYMGIKLPLYPFGSLVGWAAYGTLAMIVVSLPYIAFCAWISAGISGPFTSLTIASLVIGGLPLLATLGRFSHDSAKYVLYLLPWGFQTRLFHPEPLQVALAVAGCLGMAALFIWLGYRKLTTRDL